VMTAVFPAKSFIGISFRDVRMAFVRA